MLKFIMMVGLPASGKSTLAKNKKEEILKNEKQKVEIVSSDEIREKIFGNVNVQDYNAEVFKIMKILTLGYLRKNISVIYDATNLSRKRRKNFLDELYRELKDVSFQSEVITMLTDYKYCLMRNSERERKVPEESIKKMLCSFQCPTYEEGWNIINFHRQEPAIVFCSIDELIEELCDYDQKNPYHSLTLGNHIKTSIKYLEDNYANYEYKDIVKQILKYHDIGKVKARTEKEDGYCSYKGHEFASSYFYLTNHCFKRENDYLVLIAKMIEAHMIAHKPEMEKTLRKMGFNSDMIEIMKIVAECDDAGK